MKPSCLNGIDIIVTRKFITLPLHHCWSYNLSHFTSSTRLQYRFVEEFWKMMKTSHFNHCSFDRDQTVDHRLLPVNNHPLPGFRNSYMSSIVIIKCEFNANNIAALNNYLTIIGMRCCYVNNRLQKWPPSTKWLLTILTLYDGVTLLLSP